MGRCRIWRPAMGHESSHGAATITIWLATGPRALDLILVLHVFWLALGVALWARRAWGERSRRDCRRSGSSRRLAWSRARPFAGVAGARTSAVDRLGRRFVGRGFGTGAATARVRRCSSACSSRRSRWAGQLGVMTDAVGSAVGGVLPARDAIRPECAVLAICCGARDRCVGLDPGAARPRCRGAFVAGIPPGRLLELIVPGSFRSSAPERAVIV